MEIGECFLLYSRKEKYNGTSQRVRNGLQTAIERTMHPYFYNCMDYRTCTEPKHENNIPTLHGALSTWRELRDPRLDPSVAEQSLFRSIRRLFLLPKNLRFVNLDEESDDELGEDNLLLAFFLLLKGIQTIIMLFKTITNEWVGVV